MQFTGTATSANGPADIASVEWDFDYDGTFVADAAATSNLTPEHVYAEPGEYDVALRVTDSAGYTDMDVSSATIVSVDAGPDPVVDTPPLLAVTDPCVVAPRVDGVLLTMRLSKKGRPNAERAREVLGALGVNVVGVVVNGVNRRGGTGGPRGAAAALGRRRHR